MGTVFLAGGDEFRSGCLAMDEELLALSPHSPARIAIVPTAASFERPRMAAENGRRYFQGLGAESYPVMALSRANVESPLIASSIEGADIVYLTGGNPSYLLDTLRDTPLWGAMLAVYTGGGVIAGSSAGAMALAGLMRSRGGDWVDRLGLATRVAV